MKKFKIVSNEDSGYEKKKPKQMKKKGGKYKVHSTSDSDELKSYPIKKIKPNKKEKKSERKKIILNKVK